MVDLFPTGSVSLPLSGSACLVTVVAMTCAAWVSSSDMTDLELCTGNCGLTPS